MEFVTGITFIGHKRFILLEFLYELSDELYLLVPPAKNKTLFDFIFYNEFYLFLYNSDYYNSSDTIISLKMSTLFFKFFLPFFANIKIYLNIK
jgi:hypothetical protein